jgi:predicted PurR-regulated permease PerM
MEQVKSQFSYSKFSIILIGLVAFFYILSVGQDIIIPLVFATIIAILLNPLVNYLCKRRVNKVFAIFIALTITIVLLGALTYFIINQATMFSESLPEIKKNLLVLFNDMILWTSRTFNVSTTFIHNWINNTKVDSMDNSSAVIGQTLGTIGGVFVLIFLLPVYVFMILYYKPLLLEFISQLFQPEQHEVVGEVLLESKSLIQSYLVGLLLEAALVATLNSVGLLIIGIEYAILIGIIGALLNIIPYIGGMIAITIPMLLAIATDTPFDAVWVFVVYMIVQFIDNNFFVPTIVARKVKVNALVSIIIVLIGGALWGFSGMFLSIPLIAICKVVFDRIEMLSPLGFLIGDNQPDLGKEFFDIKSHLKKISSKKK